MGNGQRSLVKNAADPQQVRRAAQVERDRGEQFTGNLKAVLETPAGRFVIWELLARAGIYRCEFEGSAKVHFNEGRRNFGLESILAPVIEASEELYALMEREARQRQRLADRTTDAAQTPRAEEGENQS